MKKLIAIILTLAMIFGAFSVSSFAFSNGDKLTFRYLDSTEKDLYYIGEAFEGENYFEYGGGQTSVFYEFNAKESGYYSANVYYACFAQKISDSEAVQIESKAFYYDEGCCYIYLEEGTYYIADSFITAYPEPEDIRVTIEYLGEFVEVTYDESAFDCAVEGTDVDMYNKELFGANPEIVFENGSLRDYGGKIGLFCDGELKIGENNVKFEIAGVEFEEVLKIVSIRETIESIEIEDLDVFTVAYEYYFSDINNGSFGYVNPADYGTKVTVNYKDGTKITVDYCYDYKTDDYKTNIPLPDGTELPLAIYQTCFHEDGKIYLLATCEGVVLLEEECRIEKVSMDDNLNHLFGEVNKYSEYLFENISWCFEYMFNPEGLGFMYYFEHLFSGSFNLAKIIFDEIALFIGYYLGV